MADYFKDLVWDELVNAALGKLFAAVPFLGFWPISMAVTWLVVKYSDIFYHALKMMLQLEKILFVNEAHQKAFDRSSVILKILANTKGIDSEEFRSAREENKRHLSTFTRFAV